MEGEDTHGRAMRLALMEFLHQQANLVTGSTMPMPWRNDEYLTQKLAEYLFPEKHVLTQADYQKALMIGLVCGIVMGAVMALVIVVILLPVLPTGRAR